MRRGSGTTLISAADARDRLTVFPRPTVFLSLTVCLPPKSPWIRRARDGRTFAHTQDLPLVRQKAGVRCQAIPSVLAMQEVRRHIADSY